MIANAFMTSLLKCTNSLFAKSNGWYLSQKRSDIDTEWKQPCSRVLPRECFVYVVHATALTIFGIFFMHVQVIWRPNLLKTKFFALGDNSAALSKFSCSALACSHPHNQVTLSHHLLPVKWMFIFVVIVYWRLLSLIILTTELIIFMVVDQMINFHQLLSLIFVNYPSTELIILFVIDQTRQTSSGPRRGGRGPGRGAAQDWVQDQPGKFHRYNLVSGACHAHPVWIFRITFASKGHHLMMTLGCINNEGWTSFLTYILLVFTQSRLVQHFDSFLMYPIKQCKKQSKIHIIW